MAVAPWSCRPIVQPLVVSATAATLVSRSLAQSQPLVRAALGQVVRSSVQNLALSVEVRSRVSDPFVKLAATPERVALGNPVWFCCLVSVLRMAEPLVAENAPRVLVPYRYQVMLMAMASLASMT